MEATYKIDATRVFLTGFSDGGDMTSFFAAERPDLIAGIAPWAGDWSTGDGQSDSQPQADACRCPSGFGAARDDNSDPGRVSLATQDTQQTTFWINLAHDGTTPQVSVSNGNQHTSTYTGGAAEVRYTSIVGLGHSVQPGFAERTWTEFFSRFSRVSGAISSSALPAVKVRATVPKAQFSDNTKAVFLFSRNGTAADDLTVSYQLGGTAVNGVDYEMLPGSVTLPAGATSKKFACVRRRCGPRTGHRTVLLSVVPGGSYTLDDSGVAKVKIVED